MCEKAGGIQKLAPDLIPMLWVAAIPQYGYLDNDVFAKTKEGNIWLPRQDQLQAMLITEHPMGIPNASMPRRLIKYMADWYDNYPEAYWFTSMEQLWLAIVMKEKYNKVWNGDEWTSG